MAWITPKTDWVATDSINATDHNRISGNLNYLNEELHARQSELPDNKSFSDLPYASLWNAIENTLDAINQLSYEFEIGSKQEFRANGNYIDYAELNRIESAILKIGLTWQVEKACMPHLAFRLGNSKTFDVPRV